MSENSSHKKRSLPFLKSLSDKKKVHRWFQVGLHTYAHPNPIYRKRRSYNCTEIKKLLTNDQTYDDIWVLIDILAQVTCPSVFDKGLFNINGGFYGISFRKLYVSLWEHVS